MGCLTYRFAVISFFLFLVNFSQAQKARLVIPSGHTNPVISISIDRQERILASAEQTATIKIWDLQTKMELYSFQGHTAGVNEVAFSPTADVLASASDDHSVILWNIRRSTKQSVLTGHTDAVKRVKFSKDGALLVSASYDGTVKIWNVADGSLNHQIEVGNPIHSIATSSNDKFLLLGTRSGDLMIYKLDSGQQITTIPLGTTINDIQYSPDEKFIVTADNAGQVTIIDAVTSQVLNTIQAFTFRAYKLGFTQESGVFMVVGRDSKRNITYFNVSGEPMYPDLKLDGDSPGSVAGINTLLFNKSKSTLYIPDYSSCIREYTNAMTSPPQFFCGKAKPIAASSIDPSGKIMAIASNRPEVLIMDLTGATNARLIKGHSGPVQFLAFHPTQSKLITASADGFMKIWDTKSWMPIASYPIEPNYAGTPIYFDTLANGFYKKSSAEGLDFYSIDDVKSRHIKIKEIFDFRIRPGGKTLMVKSLNTLSFYPLPKLKKPTKISIDHVSGMDYITASQFVIVDGEYIRIFDAESLHEIKSFPLSTGIGSNNIKTIPNKNWAVTWNSSAGKFGAAGDHSLKIWNLKDGNLISSLEGHTAAITSVQILNDKFLFSSSTDGSIRIWSLDEKLTNPYKATLIPLDESNWAVTSLVGLFDATADAMHSMHYIQGSSIIDIDQMKQTYFEPALLPKLLGYNQEPIRSAMTLDEFELYPEVNLLHPFQNNGKLGIDLTDRGGGFGQVQIFINDKEIVRDLTEVIPVDKRQPEISLSYSLESHPNLKTGEINKVSVKAYNNTGDLMSRPKNIYLLPANDSQKQKSKLYALIVGVSDYSGTELDLQFAAKDAIDIANAIQISTDKFMGKENTNISLLTTENVNPSLRPTKANIKHVFEDFAKNANASDILFIYLAGHGMTYGGPDGDFYYLTEDAQNGSLTDEQIRNEATISSAELTEMINRIPASKQVMIIDACHSGQLVSNLAKMSPMSSTQVRAMETLKDKTGLYVLAGSESDEVSYEASSYAHGILTYSLLFGIKGPALRENEFVDIIKLFQFAINKVPQLAIGIGGAQKPEIRIPTQASSFDIGKISEDERERIILSSPKPVFIRSEFQDEVQLYDMEDLSTEVDAQLKIKAAGGVGKLDFIDTRRFSNGFTLRGRYTKEENIISASVKIFKENKLFYEFEIKEANSLNLAKAIVDIASDHVIKLQ